MRVTVGRRSVVVGNDVPLWAITGAGVSLNEGGRGIILTWFFGYMLYVGLWLSPRWNWHKVVGR
jgi:hypothetical protein